MIPNERFRDALSAVARALVTAEPITEEQRTEMLMEVYESWDEEDAQEMNKWTPKNFSHTIQKGEVWILINPFANIPYLGLTRDKLPRHWIDDNTNNGH